MILGFKLAQTLGAAPLLLGGRSPLFCTMLLNALGASSDLPGLFLFLPGRLLPFAAS